MENACTYFRYFPGLPGDINRGEMPRFGWPRAVSCQRVCLSRDIGRCRTTPSLISQSSTVVVVVADLHCTRELSRGCSHFWRLLPVPHNTTMYPDRSWTRLNPTTSDWTQRVKLISCLDCFVKIPYDMPCYFINQRRKRYYSLKHIYSDSLLSATIILIKYLIKCNYNERYYS